MTDFETWSLIILAGGKGTRMGGDTPKPLVELGGKPLIQPIIDYGLALGFAQVIVVLSEHTLSVKERFADPRITYVVTEPAGTGHAVLMASEVCTAPQMMIAQADDSYFYTQDTLQQLIRFHRECASEFTLAVARMYSAVPYGSVRYDAQGHLQALLKSPEDLMLPAPKDIVCGLYAAESAWLAPQLHRIPINGKGERGLPSVIDFGLAESAALFVFRIPDGEWHGINTPEDLIQAEQKLHTS